MYLVSKKKTILGIYLNFQGGAHQHPYFLMICPSLTAGTPGRLTPNEIQVTILRHALPGRKWPTSATFSWCLLSNPLVVEFRGSYVCSVICMDSWNMSICYIQVHPYSPAVLHAARFLKISLLDKPRLQFVVKAWFLLRSPGHRLN